MHALVRCRRVQFYYAYRHHVRIAESGAYLDPFDLPQHQIAPTDGIYSDKSAYNLQFQGSYSTFRSDTIWQAEAEGKHKCFAWLLVQCKILTADKLLARQWPCNPICSLCNVDQGRVAHLILHCSFAHQVWERLQSWTNQLIQIPAQELGVVDWWEKELYQLPKKVRRLKAALMIYGAWNIWKARNKCVFEQRSSTPAQVVHDIKEEANCRTLAYGSPELSLFND